MRVVRDRWYGPTHTMRRKQAVEWDAIPRSAERSASFESISEKTAWVREKFRSHPWKFFRSKRKWWKTETRRPKPNLK